MPDAAMPDAVVDADAFWGLGPLPPPSDARISPALDLLGRPEITVDGRNLADVLRPAYPPHRDG